jgi:threonylcarbamoyladenosine tRNA methylthiotransferase MtaB
MSPSDSSKNSNQRYEFTIHTYGCKVNTYDTGLLQKRLESQGHQALDLRTAMKTPVLERFGLGSRVPRVHILNTCAVTAEATREAAKQVRRLKAKDPFSTVVVTGCGAQVDGETFDKLPGADLVVANSHKGYLERLLDDHFKGVGTERVFRSNIFRKGDLEAGGGIEAGHTRSFLKIQDGCNSFCTYCVIPFARGRSRSIPAGELILRIRELRARGAGEVVLTGVHIGDYEERRGDRTLLLHDLVAEVLAKTDVPRIRLSSLEPVELTPELLALYRDNDRLCPHFHMSIQSANTSVLSGMKRNYSAEQVEWSLNAIAEAKPGAFVGMDVIVGFPGESEEEFADTYARLERTPWTRIHVFPYSERPGTKAAAYDGSVSRETRVLRSQRLRELSLARFETMARAQIGLKKKALILKAPGKGAEGLTRDYWPVQLEETAGLTPGSEVDIEITGYLESSANRTEGVLRGVACHS